MRGIAVRVEDLEDFAAASGCVAFAEMRKPIDEIFRHADESAHVQREGGIRDARFESEQHRHVFSPERRVGAVVRVHDDGGAQILNHRRRVSDDVAHFSEMRRHHHLRHAFSRRDVFHDGRQERASVLGARARAELVDEAQRSTRGVVNHPRDGVQGVRKSALGNFGFTLGIVLEPDDAREDAIGETDSRRRRRDEGTDVREKHDDADRLNHRRLSRPVRAGDDFDASAVRREFDVVGNELVIHEGLVQRMPRALYAQRIVVDEFGSTHVESSRDVRVRE